MLIKDIHIPYLTKLDETSINLVRPGYKEKYANVKLCDEVYKELENFKGKPNKTYILVVSVSPEEYWGCNKNHDSFSEEDLKKRHHTFVQDGTFFKNHVNKDKSKNYGDNELSWYDDLMKRVLVLIGVDNSKAPDIVNDIESGKKISVSMGCKIMADVCSICGNKAPTRNEYCHHAKNEMGKIYADGRKVFVRNPDPTFFDLSKVVRPAGHIEFMIKVVKPKYEKIGELWLQEGIYKDKEVMKKIAEETEKKLDSDPELERSVGVNDDLDIEDKLANIKKLCAMEKVITGRPVEENEISNKLKELINKSKDIKIIRESEDVDNNTIKKLATYPLKDIFSTANLLGVKLKYNELAKIAMLKFVADDAEINSVYNEMEKVGFSIKGIINSTSPISYLDNNKEIFRSLIKTGMFKTSEENVNKEVAYLLAPYFFSKNVVPSIIEKRAYLGLASKPKLDTQSVVDTEGSQYLTTNEALSRAHEMKLLQNAGKGVGLAGLLAGAWAAAPRLPIIGSKWLRPAALFGTLWGAKEINDRYLSNPSMQTQSGMEVPPYTIMKKMSSLVDKEDINSLFKVAQYDQEMMYGMMPNYPQNENKVYSWIKNNPELSIFMGLLGGGAGVKALSGMKGLLTKAPITMAPEALKPVTENVGKLLGQSRKNILKKFPSMKA